MAWRRAVRLLHLGIVMVVAMGCAACRTSLYLPAEGGEWRLAGAGVSWDRWDGAFYWIEEFTLRHDDGELYWGRTSGYESFGDGTTGSYESWWSVRLSPEGSEHLKKGEGWSRCLESVTLPARPCAGDSLAGPEGYEARVADFEPALTFDGWIPECLRVEISNARGAKITEWHAPNRGPVRIEVRVAGLLIWGAAAYGRTEPSRGAVLDLFDWPESILSQERPRAVEIPEIRASPSAGK